MEKKKKKTKDEDNLRFWLDTKTSTLLEISIMIRGYFDAPRLRHVAANLYLFTAVRFSVVEAPCIVGGPAPTRTGCSPRASRSKRRLRRTRRGFLGAQEAPARHDPYPLATLDTHVGCAWNLCFACGTPALYDARMARTLYRSAVSKTARPVVGLVANSP